MKWKKLGLVYCVTEKTNWRNSHAANPWPEHLHDDVFRIYFSPRDEQGRSNITYLDYDIVKQVIVKKPTECLISAGAMGLFDDSGCSMGSLVKTPTGEKRLYYMGWHLNKLTPWGNFVGMAMLDEKEGKWRKYSRVPVIDRSDSEPVSLSFPTVIFEKDVYRLWFGTIPEWQESERHSSSPARMKTGVSLDGIHWKIREEACFERRDANEYAFCRPSVILDEGIYKMFYSYKGESFRIGYAESEDGAHWFRKDDEVGIDVSAAGWDSEMIEYPAVFEHKGDRYMLYCGNGYGESGFGLARMDES